MAFDTNLMRPVPVGEMIAAGIEKGQAKRAELDKQQAITSAMAALNGPGREAALQRLYSASPELGMRMEDQLAQRDDRARADQFRSAAGRMIVAGDTAERHPDIQSLDPHVDSIMAGAKLIRQVNPTDDKTWNDVRSMAGRAGVDLTGVPARFDPDYVRGILTMADHLAGGGQSAPQQVAAPQGAPEVGGDQAQSDFAQAAMADPEKFLTFQGKQVGLTKAQLEVAQSINDQAMQLLGGVHDQPSYEAAKQAAAHLYADHGQDFSQLQLPDQYSPETVRDLQMRGMDTAHQLEAIARENRVNLYAENVRSDNSRADRTAQSQDEYRRGRLKLAEAPKASRQPQPRQPSPSSVIGGIMQKQASGQALTQPEQQVLTDYRAQRGGRSRPAGGGADLIGQVYRRGNVFVQYSKSAGKYVRVNEQGNPQK